MNGIFICTVHEGKDFFCLFLMLARQRKTPQLKHKMHFDVKSHEELFHIDFGLFVFT